MAMPIYCGNIENTSAEKPDQNAREVAGIDKMKKGISYQDSQVPHTYESF